VAELQLLVPIAGPAATRQQNDIFIDTSLVVPSSEGTIAWGQGFTQRVRDQ
jgi:hypothetical protein